MFDLIREGLLEHTYDSVEEYNAEVLRISCSLQEELGRAERFYLSEEGRKEIFDE